jgi:ribosomal protein L4
LYNKRNNVLILNGLEESIDTPKTKYLESIFKNCRVQLDKKVFLIVSNKTVPIKLSVRNMKNVELISASHLNTLSLLKAKQILLTPLAIKDIKETFCD